MRRRRTAGDRPPLPSDASAGAPSAAAAGAGTAERSGTALSTDPVQQLVAALRGDLRAALRSGDRASASPLRELLAVIDNAGAVDVPQGYDYTGEAPTEVPRREVTIDEVAGLLRAIVTERRDAAATFRELGHEERAREHHQAAALLERYLPIDG